MNKATILITGGTGSFGSTVLRHLLDKGLQEIRIFSRDEKKQEDMRIALNSKLLKFYIGDVRDRDSITSAMRGVDFVFHAAALKQVPSCEFFPLEAMKTNVIGTSNVLKAAIENNVKRVVCLSTDKAAYPVNAMGISKALMEKVIIAECRNIKPGGPVVSITRYGNVMASRGSVIPLFIKQIKERRDLTITDPRMTRFLMSLDEAVDLVLFAFKNGQQGDLFVQKAPACTIDVLASALKQIFAAKTKTKIMGSRHGEKLHETLLTSEEMSRAVDLGKYFRVRPDIRELRYSKYLQEGDLSLLESVDYTSRTTNQLSVSEVINKLMDLDYVPEIVALKNEKK